MWAIPRRERRTRATAGDGDDLRRPWTLVRDDDGVREIECLCTASGRAAERGRSEVTKSDQGLRDQPSGEKIALSQFTYLGDDSARSATGIATKAERSHVI